MKTNRKGFTITELVIVIVVIAILAAVLIPTFASLIKKANLSADQQAVRQMNTALSVEGAAKKNDIFAVYDALSEMGMTAKDYKPLTSDTYFFWDADLDRVLHVDANKKVLYPAEYADLSYVGRTWMSLNAQIATKAPEGYTAGDTSVSVNTPEEMAYIVEQVKENKAAEGLTIDLSNKTLDMMGASLNMANEGSGKITTDFTISNGTLTNVSVIDAAHEGTGGDGNDGVYNAGGLFGAVQAGSTVIIKDVKIENINIKNTDVSGAAILVAQTSGGKIVIENVTIKNSTVIAHRNAGALVGNASDSGEVVLKGTIKMENVHVKTVGGRSGLLIGYVKDEYLKCDSDLKIELTNCSYSIYQCEQNTGTFDGQKLGLDESTNILHSYAYNNASGKNELEDKKFFEGAYATERTDNKGQAKYTGLDQYVTVK